VRGGSPQSAQHPKWANVRTELDRRVIDSGGHIVELTLVCLDHHRTGAAL